MENVGCRSSAGCLEGILKLSHFVILMFKKMLNLSLDLGHLTMSVFKMFICDLCLDLFVEMDEVPLRNLSYFLIKVHSKSEVDALRDTFLCS